MNRTNVRYVFCIILYMKKAALVIRAADHECHTTPTKVYVTQRSCISTTQATTNTTNYCHSVVYHTPYNKSTEELYTKMKILSIREFQKFCTMAYPAVFCYDASNQRNGDCMDIKFISKYSEVITMMNPNRICFRNECGTLCLNRVKSIRYHDEQQIGDVFSIVCGDKNEDSHDTCCTIVVDKK